MGHPYVNVDILLGNFILIELKPSVWPAHAQVVETSLHFGYMPNANGSNVPIYTIDKVMLFLNNRVKCSCHCVMQR